MISEVTHLQPDTKGMVMTNLSDTTEYIDLPDEIRKDVRGLLSEKLAETAGLYLLVIEASELPTIQRVSPDGDTTSLHPSLQVHLGHYSGVIVFEGTIFTYALIYEELPANKTFQLWVVLNRSGWEYVLATQLVARALHVARGIDVDQYFDVVYPPLRALKHASSNETERREQAFTDEVQRMLNAVEDDWARLSVEPATSESVRTFRRNG